MELNDLMRRAMDIRQRYAELEAATQGQSWTLNDIAIGFVGDVGDLMKLIQAHNGARNIPDWEPKLAHELADCLWSVLVLANQTGVDLERAFMQTMDDLEQHIEAAQNQS